MANVVVSQVTNDGPRNHVVHIQIQADGSGDEISFPVVAPDLVDPVCDRFSVKKIQATISGEFGVRLAFDGTTEVPFMETQAPTVATQTDQINQDYTISGGIPDPQIANYTGAIVLTTDGMDSAGDTAYIHLELIKHGVT